VTHTYELDGSIIVQETWGENQLVPIYDVTGSILGILYNSTPYYFMRNLQGDIIGVVNSSGTLVAEYSYDAWGKCSIVEDNSGVDIANVNPFRYRGYYYDSEIGLYYCNARYYDAEVGRWISADAIRCLDKHSACGLNLYVYCDADPNNKFDPYGYYAISSVLVGLGIAALIGAIVGAASYTAVQVFEYTVTGDFDWSWGGFAGAIVGGAIAGIMNKIGVYKLNVGMGSFSAIHNQINTQFIRGVINGISIKTFFKMLTIELYDGIAGNIIDCIYSLFDTKNWMINLDE